MSKVTSWRGWAAKGLQKLQLKSSLNAVWAPLRLVQAFNTIIRCFSVEEFTDNLFSSYRNYDFFIFRYSFSQNWLAHHPVETGTIGSTLKLQLDTLDRKPFHFAAITNKAEFSCSINLRKLWELSMYQIYCKIFRCDCLHAVSKITSSEEKYTIHKCMKSEATSISPVWYMK